MVLRDNEEPCHREHGGVSRINQGVKHVKPGECDALERRLLANVWRKEGSQDESEYGVYVHRELER